MKNKVITTDNIIGTKGAHTQIKPITEKVLKLAPRLCSKSRTIALSTVFIFPIQFAS